MRVASDIATLLLRNRRDKETPTGQDGSQSFVKVSDRELKLMQSLDTCRETITLCMSSSAACRVNALQSLNSGQVSCGRFAFQQELMGIPLVPTFLLVVLLCTVLALRRFKAMHFYRRKNVERWVKKDLDEHHYDIDASSAASSGNDVLSRVTWTACRKQP